MITIISSTFVFSYRDDIFLLQVVYNALHRYYQRRSTVYSEETSYNVESTWSLFPQASAVCPSFRTVISRL